MDLKQTAAFYKLNLVTGEELRTAADQALGERLFSPALADLAFAAGLYLEEYRSMFERVLTELQIPPPSEEEAVWCVLRYYLNEIAEGRILPREGMRRVTREIVDDYLHSKSKEYLGDTHGLEKLIGAYYSCDDVSGDEKKKQAEIAAIDLGIIQLAKDWIKTYGRSE